MVKKDLSLYFHIPFCKKKCPYCHFFSVQDQLSLIPHFLKLLKIEWDQKLPLLDNYEIVSIYLGGGTPSLLKPHELETILSWTLPYRSPNKPIEITIEMNPDQVCLDLLQSYKKFGINRISLGVQSFVDEDLKILQRTYTSKQAYEACLLIEESIPNYSIDLLYDLPNQTIHTLEKSLAYLEKIHPKHLSLYNLTIEPKTPFFYKQNTLYPLMPNSEKSKEIQLFCIQKIEEYHLYRYEISAFAKKGYESIHNSGYWQGRSYLGFGPSSHSFYDQKRFANVSSLYLYEEKLKKNQSPVEFEEKLSLSERQAELFTINLRLLRGVEIQQFEKIHGKLAPLLFSKIQKLQQEDFLSFDNGFIKLTQKGLLFYDLIAEELIE